MQVRPKLLYPLMVIAAVAVTVFSLLGIATLSATIPLAHSAAGALSTAANTEEALPKSGMGSASHSQSLVCRYCGGVESVKLVEMNGQGIGVGAVAAGGAYAGNERSRENR
ncbi:MAG TPA: hypothetical protein VIM43_00465 [Rugosibacter sp.]